MILTARNLHAHTYPFCFQSTNPSLNQSFVLYSFILSSLPFLHSLHHSPSWNWTCFSSLELNFICFHGKATPYIAHCAQAMSWHFSSPWKPCTQSTKHPGSVSTGSRSVHGLVDSLGGCWNSLVCYTDVAVEPLLLRNSAQSQNQIGWLRWFNGAWRCIVSDNKVLSPFYLIQQGDKNGHHWGPKDVVKCGGRKIVFFDGALGGTKCLSLDVGMADDVATHPRSLQEISSSK